MNMLQQGASWLSQQRHKLLATTIQYRRNNGDVTVYAVSAALGRTLFRAENEYRMTIRIHSIDFLILSSELPVEPARGDEIIYNGKRYEVLAPNDEPCWRWSSDDTYRIHTKEIG